MIWTVLVRNGILTQNTMMKLLLLSDVDECLEDIHDCAHDQICTNNDGSFMCSCGSGYTLASNGEGCNGNNYSIYQSILIMELIQFN